MLLCSYIWNSVGCYVTIVDFSTFSVIDIFVASIELPPRRLSYFRSLVPIFSYSPRPTPNSLVLYLVNTQAGGIDLRQSCLSGWFCTARCSVYRYCDCSQVRSSCAVEFLCAFVKRGWFRIRNRDLLWDPEDRSSGSEAKPLQRSLVGESEAGVLLQTTYQYYSDVLWKKAKQKLRVKLRHYGSKHDGDDRPRNRVNTLDYSRWRMHHWRAHTNQKTLGEFKPARKTTPGER